MTRHRRRNYCPSVNRNVTWAEFSTWEPSFEGKRSRSTGAQAHGIRYERKVQRYLTALCSGHYIPAPWFRYCTHNHPHWPYCQPDGLLFNYNRNLITIVEIKLGHSLQAWEQVRTLYGPVIDLVFGSRWRFAACEVTAHYDPAIEFPERLHHITRLSSLQPGQFGLYILRERKLNERARPTSTPG